MCFAESFCLACCTGFCGRIWLECPTCRNSVFESITDKSSHICKLCTKLLSLTAPSIFDPSYYRYLCKLRSTRTCLQISTLLGCYASSNRCIHLQASILPFMQARTALTRLTTGIRVCLAVIPHRLQMLQLLGRYSDRLAWRSLQRSGLHSS